MNEVTSSAAGPAATPWSIRLPSFQGPIDLLLHLLRTDAIQFADVPLLDVARQYDDYLALRSPDLDLAGEYLLLAATLVHMKSRALLPADPAETEPLDDLPGDPGRSLPGAQGIRRATEHLQEREALMELVYARPADSVAQYAGEQGIEADLSALLRAFQAILRRVGNDPASRVSRERMTLVERIDWLLETLARERSLGFRTLFAGLADRVSCILTFLALLELIRLQLVRAYQSHHQKDLLVVLCEETPPATVKEDRVDG
jgi:segregation and condensation protein A